MGHREVYTNTPLCSAWVGTRNSKTTRLISTRNQNVILVLSKTHFQLKVFAEQGLLFNSEKH